MENMPKPGILLFVPHPDRKDVLVKARALEEIGFQVQVHTLEFSPDTNYLKKYNIVAGVWITNLQVSSATIAPTMAMKSHNIYCRGLPPTTANWGNLLKTVQDKYRLSFLQAQSAERGEKSGKAEPEAGDWLTAMAGTIIGLDQSFSDWDDVYEALKANPLLPSTIHNGATLEETIERRVNVPERCPQIIRSWWEDRKPKPSAAPAVPPRVSEEGKAALAQVDEGFATLYREAEQINTALQSQINTLTAEKERCDRTILAMLADSEANSSKLTKTQADLSSARLSLEKVIKELQELKTDYAAAKRALDARGEEIASLKQAVAQADNQPKSPISSADKEHIRALLASGFLTAEEILKKVLGLCAGGTPRLPASGCVSSGCPVTLSPWSSLLSTETGCCTHIGSTSPS